MLSVVVNMQESGAYLKDVNILKPGQKNKIFANLLLADLAVTRSFEVVVSDMAAFWCNQVYYEHGSF